MPVAAPSSADTWKRRLVLAYVGSFVLFAAFPIFRIHDASKVLRGTDHYSHWGTAILFGLHGFDIYRVPTKALCDQPTAAELAENPRANCVVRDHPSIKPLGIAWADLPRVYPPGVLLFVAPEAILFALSWIGFGMANLIMVLTMLAAAHLASLALLRCLWRDGDERGWQSLLLFVVMPLAHLDLVSAALTGLYDEVPVVALLAGAWLLTRNRPTAALLALSLGIFTHFRSLWYLPLLCWAMVQAWQTRRTWLASRGSVAAVAVSALALAVSLWCFITLWPVLRDYHLSNPAGVRAFEQDPTLVIAYGVPVLGLLAVLARNGNWLTLATAFWQLVMVVETREVQQWHALFLWPLIGVAGLERRAHQVAVSTVLLLYLWEARVVFRGWPLGGDLIVDLLRT